MMDPRRPMMRPDRAQGFGLIEIMIGLVIGLIGVLVIYQVYSVAEGFRRNTTAAGEAQMTGLFSTFVLGMELANGGAVMAVAASDLASCTPTANIATTFRPIPVLITDGGGPAKPDSFVVNYSIASTMASTTIFNFNANADDVYQIESPGGFHVGDLIVAIVSPGPDGASDCVSSKVTQVAVQDPVDINMYGAVTKVSNTSITHSGTGTAFSFTGHSAPNPPIPPNFNPGGSKLFNMGPADRAQKILYRLCDLRVGCPQPPVCGVGTPCTLQSVPLLDSNGAPAALPGNPLASNIVNMKVEYGIDGDLDALGLLDTWVQASAAGWDPATLLAAPVSKLNQVKAIRIGIIVQSEQFDQTLGDYNWVLFDCNTGPCPGRLTGKVSASTSPPGNWRFRKYETIIPLRNEIWNKAT